jgi:hypothetical protein
MLTIGAAAEIDLKRSTIVDQIEAELPGCKQIQHQGNPT